MLELKGAIFTENKENKVIDDEMMAKDTLFLLINYYNFILKRNINEP